MQLGIDGALNANPKDFNLIISHDPELQTVHNIWIPLAVLRDALPLFVKVQDEIMASEVSISYCKYWSLQNTASLFLAPFFS